MRCRHTAAARIDHITHCDYAAKHSNWLVAEAGGRQWGTCEDIAAKAIGDETEHGFGPLALKAIIGKIPDLRSNPACVGASPIGKAFGKRDQEQRTRHRENVSEAALEVCGEQWQSAVAMLASHSVESELWSSRPQPCRRRHCRNLAKSARSLLRFQKLLHTMAGDSAAELWATFRPNRFEVNVARQIVKRLPLPTDEAFAQAARCLRALGILCCLMSSREMTECRCTGPGS